MSLITIGPFQASINDVSITVRQFDETIELKLGKSPMTFSAVMTTDEFDNLLNEFIRSRSENVNKIIHHR